MSKKMPIVNFRYGQKEFENLMVYILNIKLEEPNLKIREKNYTTTVSSDEVKR
ncbi:hypothetical protein [Clostridium botulinum]|uniref:hypothetical protein n=1 Tax=Clostridium botulinum TaxID=1491 RepID=UPI00020750AC|nr:hypothetical protein [Clostridium botulinum]AEB76997.1 hypothetical protein CbC4_2332 [Clostridium botulinum BKT015925]MCD3197185.1 hypothetical protein [Clostridium botulinum C/D]MCD3204354.1 hypothetical protein [Clostridium botulinum C/D]MCD3211123.1 hypothetical protein [Clostridium botulinum C/D]MCD3213615.1 hypothetical protein [Clostridium botulinum C/D]